jgi:hypothetical protein
VSEDERAPGGDEVQVAVAVDIPDPRSVTAGDEGRRAADRAMRTNRAVDAARDQALRRLEERR